MRAADAADDGDGAADTDADADADADAEGPRDSRAAAAGVAPPTPRSPQVPPPSAMARPGSARGHRTDNAHVVFVREPGMRQYAADAQRGPYPIQRGGYGGGAWGSWTSATAGYGRQGGARGRQNSREGLGRWLMLDEDEWVDMGAFASKKIRRAFIIKVYSMLMLQLAVTVAIISLVCFLATFAVLLFCDKARRRQPWGTLLLIIFTLAFAHMLGMASAYHSTYVVFMAAAITAVISVVITVVAVVTKVDLTGCGSLLCVLALGVVTFGFMLVAVFFIWGDGKLLIGVFAGLVAIVFSLYLMFDTQLIMGGKHKELSTDEYVFAAVMLFVDIADLMWSALMTFAFCCGE